MIAACLLVAGVLRATLAADHFTLAWRHSVEKTRWEEHYRVDGRGIVLEESRVEGFGAGMEPPAGAILVDAMWRWRPNLGPLPELRLTSSPYTDDYRICWAARCAGLRELVPGDVDVVTVTPCQAPG